MHHGTLNSTLTPIVPSDSLGVILIGVYVGWWMCGINVFLAFFYFSKYSKDRTRNKLAVGFVTLLDFIYAICLCQEPYDWAVNNFGNYEALILLSQGHVVGGFVASVLTLTVQSVYAFRAFDMSKLTPSKRGKGVKGQWWVPVAISCLSLSCFTIGTYFSVQQVLVDGNAILLAGVGEWAVLAWWCLGAATDLFISGCCTFLVWRAKTAYRETNAILVRILILCFETNGLTSLLQVLMVAVYWNISTGSEVMLYQVLLHAYTLSLLVTMTFRPSQTGGSTGITSRDGAKSSASHMTHYSTRGDRTYELAGSSPRSPYFPAASPRSAYFPAPSPRTAVFPQSGSSPRSPYFPQHVNVETVIHLDADDGMSEPPTATEKGFAM